MNMGQRNEEIWKLRREGVTYSRIAEQFDLSCDRVRQICSKKKARMENAHRWPPLKKVLSDRVKNVLIKVFGGEEIFEHPEKLASLGPKAFFKWRNMGKKNVNELMDSLESLGFNINRDMGMTGMKGQNYFKVGKTILHKYFDYYIKHTIDDTEYIPVVRLIIEGIAKEMKSSGMPEPGWKEVARKLKDFNLQMYQNIWIKHAKEDYDPEDEEHFDLEKESELAKYTFDYIYKHGKHPPNHGF